MVAVDEQYPYRLYVPQQDNTTLIVPSVPPVSWGLDHPAQFWVQASGCETGGIWPRKDGQVVWGACKGEVGRYNVVTGQEKHYWIYPQNRYGHDPDEIKYRFPRQTVIYLSPHDDKIVYQASHVLHRSTDEGVTWETISPDLTAREPQYQVLPGNPITRDITGEEVYSSIYSMVESRLEKGVIWVGANDGPVHVSRDNGKTWKNVTPKGLGARRPRAEHRRLAARKGTAYVAIYRYLREHDLKPYIYKTENYGESWTLLTDGKNGIPIGLTRLASSARIRRAKACSTPAPSSARSCRSTTAATGRSLAQNLPATPVTDIRVHRNDLVISTMGRSLWIMDNVTPLQQIAAMLSGARPTNNQAAHQRWRAWDLAPPHSVAHSLPRWRAWALAPPNSRWPAAARRCRPCTSSSRARRFAIGTPRTRRQRRARISGARRTRRRLVPGRPAGRHEARRARRQGSGRPQLWRWAARRRPRAVRRCAARSAAAGGASTIRPEAGMQRFTWDMRHPGPWAANAPNGGGGGPMVDAGQVHRAAHVRRADADPRRSI